MEAFLSCLDEIALDGLDGCPIQQLWKHLEERKPPFPLKLDSAAKEFIWKAIVDMPGVEFFVLDKPLPHVFGAKCNDADEMQLMRSTNPVGQYQGPLKESNDFKLVSDQDLGIRGSCPGYQERQNITEEIRSQTDYQSLETVFKRWGNCLVMVASQELREKALLGVHCDPNLAIIDIQYCLLEHIGQARYNGRMQRAMGSSFLKMEPKSLFHYLKGLRMLGLITLQPVIITSDSSKPAFTRYEGGRNYHTNVIRLKRFHVQELHRYDVLATSLSKLLMNSPNQELPLSEIQKQVSESKKVLKNVRRYLQQAGYVVEEKIWGATSEGENPDSNCPPAKKKKKKKTESSTTVCPSAYPIKVRLLKPFVLKTNDIWQSNDIEEEEDDDEEEEEEDGENDVEGKEKDARDNDCRANIVAERPLPTQVYAAIYKAGCKGCTLKALHRACTLPFRDLRSIVNDMKKKKLVQEVLQDIGKTNVAWIVATPLMKSNIQTMKVKQVQDQLKEMEMKALEQHAPEDTTPDKTPSQTHSPSPVPSEGSNQQEKIPPSNNSVIAKKVTYRKLKRKQLILEFIEKKKVVEGCFPFQKAIICSEEEEGHEGKIDKKVVSRFLEDCNSQGLIKKISTVVNHENVLQKVDLYLHPSISNDSPKVAHALDLCRTRIKEERFKAAERQEKAKQHAEEKQKKKQEKSTASVENKEKNHEEQETGEKAQDNGTSTESTVQTKATDSKANKPPPHKYSLLPRFYRAQAIHELLWMLVYGDDSQQEISDEDNDSQANSDLEESLDRSDNWMKCLKPLAKVCNDDGTPLRGWFRFSDVLSVLPVSILCRTIDIAGEIEGFDEFAIDPANKNTLIGDLPQPLKGRILENGRVKSAPSSLLTNLAHMGLVTPLLPLPHTLRDAKIFLSKGSKLLDTRNSIAGYHTASPPPEKPFELRTHLFTSMGAVRSYWRDLNCVCLNTPLGVVRTDDALESNVKNTRLVQFAKENVDEVTIKLPPGDNLGAGGLDRCLFSHLQKNWTRLLTKSSVGTFQGKRKLSAPKKVSGGETVSSGSEPEKQRNQKRVLPLGTAETKKLAKKGKGQQKTRKRKAEDSQGTEVMKKRRTDSDEKAKSSKHKKATRAPTSVDGHLTAIDDEDRNILARKTNERITFTAEEDSWLLMFHIALAVMKHETTLLYPFVSMRDVLHKACTTSFDKTAPNIKRRILKLLRNPHSKMTIKICVAECAQDESFQGFDDPQADFVTTFMEVVRRLRQKFSASSLSCDGDLPMVSSVKELYEKYKVQALVDEEAQIELSDDSISSLGPAINSVADITKAAIRDQIQIAFTTPQELYDAYRVFQMFNSFTWEELHAVFKDMQNKNLVTRKRAVDNPSTQLLRSLPFASLTFQLSVVYHRLFLQGSKLDKLRKEFSQFWKQLKRGEEHTLLGSDTVTSCNTENKDASSSVEGNSHRSSYGDEGLGSNGGDRNSVNSAVIAGDDRLGSESTISNSNHANNSCEGNNSIGNGADVPCSSNGHTIGGNGAINDSAGAEDNIDSNVASNSRSNTGDGSISIGVNDIKSSNSVTCPNQAINQTNLTSGVIEVKPKCTLGGHVACILSLLVTGKAYVEVNIPDEILNMDPSELADSSSENDAQQQMSEDTADVSVHSSSAALSDKNSEEDAPLSPHPRENETEPRRTPMSPPMPTTPRNTVKRGAQSPASTKGKSPAAKSKAKCTPFSPTTKSGGKGKSVTASKLPRVTRVEEREVYTLKLPSAVVTKFTSASDLNDVKDSTSALSSCPEIVQVACAPLRSTVPVASLSQTNFSSRSSRTMLMLARGGNDPYNRIKQLPARALNTHDFMSLYPCRNLLRVTDTKLLTDSQNGLNLGDSENSRSESCSVKNTVSEAASIAETGEHLTHAQGRTPNLINASSGEATSSSLTCPVSISASISLEDYLDQKKRYLEFAELDLAMVRDIYDMAAAGKELGVSLPQLQERIIERRKAELHLSHHSIEQHVKYMCVDKLLYKVGVCELRLVTANFVKPWSMSLLKPKKDIEKFTVKEPANHQEEIASIGDSQETNSKNDDDLNLREKTADLQTDSTSAESQTSADCESSTVADEVTVGKGNNQESDQTGVSLESAGDNEKQPSKPRRRKKSKTSNYECHSVVCRPWITIDGTTSQPLLSMFKDMVLMLVLNNPGIAKSEIAKRVYEALRPVPLDEILESLLLDGYIIKHTRQLPAKVAMFTTPHPQSEPSQVMTFYTPAVDCLMGLTSGES
ncbi:general transcription factor 3C polypeptide 1-like isoform X7 [Acropora millepora]|uniref:general transcription factor 3C polypeptide 1-like isoform X7 n=1 Tax=Acropora millepora TaxID=45264 RepID=UPI001CF53377|nr:general transcription factor 3C polypeptide 1-like isoform X7 [Acropora millepora]